jgi:hypothetical protein
MLVVNRLLAMKVESVGLITTADGLLVHDGIHCLVFSAIGLTWFIRYICY